MSLPRHPLAALFAAAGPVLAERLQTAAPADIVKIVPPDDFIGDRSLYLAALARIYTRIAKAALALAETEN